MDKEEHKIPWWLEASTFIIIILYVIFIGGYFVGLIYYLISYFCARYNYKIARENNKEGVGAFFLGLIFSLLGLWAYFAYIKMRKRSNSLNIIHFIVSIIPLVIMSLILILFLWVDIRYSSDIDYENFSTYSDEYISLKYPSHLKVNNDANSAHLIFYIDEDPASEVIRVKFYENEPLRESTYNRLLGLESNMVNQTIIQHINSTLAGHNATKVVYTYNQTIDGINYEIKAMRVTAILPDLIIQIGFTASPTNYDKSINDIDKLIESIRVY